MKMSSSRPYMLRATYEWLEDNKLTPYLMIDAEYDGVQIPMEHVQDGQITLNVSSVSTRNLLMANDKVSFDASFGGVVYKISLPIFSIKAIYSVENGRGMVFEDEEDVSDDSPTTDGGEDSSKPTLRVVK